MTRLRISLVLLFASLAAVAPAQDSSQDYQRHPRAHRVDYTRGFALERTPPRSAAQKAEIDQATQDVLKYADADADGKLSHREGNNARDQILEVVIDRLPAASYISGGETTIDRLRHRVRQMSIDKNRDQMVDDTELSEFVAYAIAESDKALRTHYYVEFGLMMERTRPLTYRSTVELEAERSRWRNAYWRTVGIKQQQMVRFDVQARRRLQKAQGDADIQAAREAAERDWLLRETSPGGVPNLDPNAEAPPAEPPPAKAQPFPIPLKPLD